MDALPGILFWVGERKTERLAAFPLSLVWLIGGGW